ncbi:flavin reductase family protein [Streptomyces sp. NBC_01669]|uniref:flavin reductase family protein n=1 Tax=Streptomyces sp. NBC_01669 TaxID=2975909 RepID=UPI0022515F56|nr:flavin reductase family protein [Streptomyces sp. NBC_01669]MCX4538245.1 flavin reductase family protein [Streptomyces sp. NBC_01669]
MGTPSSSYAPSDPDALLFRKALRHFPSGVSVVTIADGDGVHGMTASSFASVSLDPPLCAVSVNKPGRMHQLLHSGDGYFALNIMGKDQGDIADFYARQPWSVALDVKMEWKDGCPTIAGALAWFLCRKWAAYDGGDHTIFVGESLEHGATERDDLDPLVWHKSRYHDLGAELARGSRPEGTSTK